MAKNFQSEFVKYYKEKLEPLGFQKVKGRQPYFVRVVNDEILHVITFDKTQSTEFYYDKAIAEWHLCKAFRLRCGVATVYRKEIDFTISPSRNGNWLKAAIGICEKGDTEFPSRETAYWKWLRERAKFDYHDENMDEMLDESYRVAEIAISVLDKITDMEGVLRYQFKYDSGSFSFMNLLKDDFSDKEELFYARKEYDYTKIKKYFEDRLIDLNNRNWSDKEKIKEHEETLAWEERIKNRRNEFINNDADYKQGMKLLKEHYNTNVNKLIGYGLNIKKKELEF